MLPLRILALGVVPLGFAVAVAVLAIAARSHGQQRAARETGLAHEEEEGARELAHEEEEEAREGEGRAGGGEQTGVGTWQPLLSVHCSGP